MVDQLIADYVIGVLKCVEEQKRVNRLRFNRLRLTVTIKLIANYVIKEFNWRWKNWAKARFSMHI